MLGELVQSAFESYRPTKAVSIKTRYIANLAVCPTEIENQEQVIIDRFKRYRGSGVAIST